MSFPLSSRVDTGSALEILRNRLTDRDRYLCSLLLDHRVLTTEHICALAFESVITTRHRLRTLYQLGVVERFRPYRVGKVMPFHFLLGEVGAHVVAADRGVAIKELDWVAARSAALVRSSRLDHLVGVNGFFASLVRLGRALDGADGLSEWWSERQCRLEWGDAVVPDGFGVWRQSATELQFFLEYDRGTESLQRLLDKVSRYRQLLAKIGPTAPVLFVFEGPRRETGFHRLVKAPTIPIATTQVDVFSRSPSAWLPVGETRRLDLADVAHWAIHAEVS